MFKQLIAVAVLSSLTTVALAREVTVSPATCYNRATFAQNTWQGAVKGQAVEQAMRFAETYQNSDDDGAWAAVRIARSDAANIYQNYRNFTMQGVYQAHLQDCLQNVGAKLDLM